MTVKEWLTDLQESQYANMESIDWDGLHSKFAAKNSLGVCVHDLAMMGIDKIESGFALEMNELIIINAQLSIFRESKRQRHM